MTDDNSHGVPKVGIAQEPLDKILNACEVEQVDENKTVHSNPLGVDCPCCGDKFTNAVHDQSAWTFAGTTTEGRFQVCVGDTPDGRIVFTHSYPSEEQ